MEFVEVSSRAELQSLEAELVRERASPGSKVEICDLGASGLEARYVVARDGDVIAGAATIVEASSELHKLYVRPDYRKAGLGAKLADQALLFARDNGFAELNIEMSGDSEAFWDRWVGDRPFEYHGERKFSVTLDCGASPSPA
ncbi:GNAT family N-acetyltransferase [Sphingomonas sp. NPDC019816]|jgi:GNAT superfamily N-acetyltransferase|uniref:GNAT family N-acetyltransferase n=1 Tax=Alphaproteobacteria TaxID=28211 RepID=UPI000F7ED3F0|nr:MULTISPECIES: GNAT family N-acetyltransferase [Alphaproteobacteria]RSV11674.1 N-acetyltransferase [Sphingomonas sp. ABOLF]TAJ29106.1 MAG: GNAT family N-acetyltransferase [Bosea sp. (in: a-proteobacteria)]|tara:strand:+ start:6994 stop:7422 length:429 start_codon:yes stop_codon:yes gene_type:complete